MEIAGITQPSSRFPSDEKGLRRREEAADGAEGRKAELRQAALGSDGK
jgi:hypothetical protein